MHPGLVRERARRLDDLARRDPGKIERPSNRRKKSSPQNVQDSNEFNESWKLVGHRRKVSLTIAWL